MSLRPASPVLILLTALCLAFGVACDSDTLTDLEDRGFLGVDVEIVLDESVELREATVFLDGDEISDQDLNDTGDDGRYRLIAFDDDVDPGRHTLEVRIDRTSDAGPKPVEMTAEATYATLGDNPDKVLDERRTETLADGEGIVFDIDL